MKRIGKGITRSRKFIFGLPAKSIEFLNGVFTLIFSITLIIHGLVGLDIGLHSNSARINSLHLGVVMLIVAILQFRYMLRDSLVSNYKSSLVLKISCLLWFISALLLGIEQTVNIIFVISCTMSFITIMAALETDTHNKHAEITRKECRNG